MFFLSRWCSVRRFLPQAEGRVKANAAADATAEHAEDAEGDQIGESASRKDAKTQRGSK